MQIPVLILIFTLIKSTLTEDKYCKDNCFKEITPPAVVTWCKTNCLDTIKTWCTDNCLTARKPRCDSYCTEGDMGDPDKSPAFKIDFDQLLGDPKSWKEPFTDKVTMAVMAVAGLYLMKAPPMWILGGGLLLLGVTANFGWVVGILAIWYGFRTKNYLIMGVASWLLWCFYKGFKVM